MVEIISKNFTLENGVYKGEVKQYLTHYKSFGELMWNTIKNHGNKIAHLDARTEETVTYAELQDKVVKCSLWLQNQGIASGDVVTVCTGNHLNSIVPCLSAAYINAITNPWYEKLDLQTMTYFVKMTTPKIIFCSEVSVSNALSTIKEQNSKCIVVVFGKHPGAISFADILKYSNDKEETSFRYVELDDIKKTALIMHSSGTTGMPKGVMLSNYSLIILSQQNNISMANVPTLWYSSLYWMTGIMLNCNGIIQGTKAIIYPEFEEEMTCQLIEKYKISGAFLSTNMMNRLVHLESLKKYSLSSLKVIITSGAPIKKKVQEEFYRIMPHIQLLNCYGMTELGNIVTLQLPNSKHGSCGTVIQNVQIKVVDLESKKILGPNQLGEICIKTPSMMTGYYKNPEATKQTIDKEGWIHSGDVGYIDENGEMFIKDRIKELIKYRGLQISPGEVESVLMSHPAILEAVVIGIPHVTDDEHPLAFATKKPGAKVTEQELVDFVAKNMMDHCKLRAGIIFLEKFPYTGSSKISKKDLREMAKRLIKQD